MGWLTISGIYMAIVVSLTKDHGLPPKWNDHRFILEQVSALAVGVGDRWGRLHSQLDPTWPPGAALSA
jgi:hypothetical protein